MKSQPPALQIKPNLASRRTETGGWDRLLFSAFRNHPEKPEVKRLETILTLLVAAQSHLTDWQENIRSIDTSGVSKFLDQSRRRKESEEAYYAALESLEAALKRYRWRSTISGDINGFNENLESHLKAQDKDSNWECAMVRLLLGVMREPGKLARLRRCCDCQQWFYAFTNHQRFCGETCRRRYASQSPEFKEKRRTYMREQYRPQQKEFERRSKTIARKNEG